MTSFVLPVQPRFRSYSTASQRLQPCVTLPTSRATTGPRQGRSMRQCVVLRELLPRQLLFRVVRSRDQHGNVVVTLADAASTTDGSARRSQVSNGRSAYVSKATDIVRQAINRNRLGRSLRCKVPPHVTRSLHEKARRWASMSNDEKGLLFCEVYGLDGMYLPHEQVQHCLPVGHDSSFFDDNDDDDDDDDK